MSLGFWEQLNKPFFVLAPMADVTDPAFRKVIAKYGKPDVMYTEFVSADGLFKGGYDALVKDLQYTEEERPIVAQFFSTDPELMHKAGALAVELGFDGVDINMGCPDKNICKQGSGAAMIRKPDDAVEIIKATKEGAGGLPVSVKTRIGYTKAEELDDWLKVLFSAEPEVITLHGRTKKEMSKVPAQWEVIKRAVDIRNENGSETLIIGNGDVVDIADAKTKSEESGCDGVMLGRAIYGNPWLFSGDGRPGLKGRIAVLSEHLKLFKELLSDVKSFATMKKHFKSYLRGEGYDKELLVQLMDTTSPDEASGILASYV